MAEAVGIEYKITEHPDSARLDRSQQLGALAAALAKAQGAIGDALKDSRNPHFGSMYADLASNWEACRAALSANGLAIVQRPSFDGRLVSVETLLLHTSDQWLVSTLSATPMKPDAQGIGSVITYLRRYALASMVGIAPAEDDGEAAVGRGSQALQQARQAAPRAAQPKAQAAPKNGTSAGPAPASTPAAAAPSAVDPDVDSAAKWNQELQGVTTRDELLSIREDLYASGPSDRLKKMVEPAFNAAQKRVKAAAAGQVA